MSIKELRSETKVTISVIYRDLGPKNEHNMPSQNLHFLSVSLNVY